MTQVLDITSFMSRSQGHLTIDVRSPKEFIKGHIPHAVSLPLFNDDERAKVGTIYKQTGRNEAIEAGLEIVGPKMAGFVRFVRPLAKENKIFVHCWRGGMRSGSMAWLLDMMGYQVYTLGQGYKAYRNLVLDDLSKKADYIVLGGRTGSGKTAILHKLKELGEQVLDLEGIAHHKGSAFGALGEVPQPTPEQFENDLHFQWSTLDTTRPIWLEDESKNIGKCYIPNGMWAHMCAAPAVLIDIPLEVRVKRLVTDYSEQPVEGLNESIIKLERRLGNEAMKQALQALNEKNYSEVARITLRYYDKAYDHSMKARNIKQITRLSFEKDDVDMIGSILIKDRSRYI